MTSGESDREIAPLGVQEDQVGESKIPDSNHASEINGGSQINDAANAKKDSALPGSGAPLESTGEEEGSCELASPPPTRAISCADLQPPANQAHLAPAALQALMDQEQKLKTGTQGSSAAAGAGSIDSAAQSVGDGEQQPGQGTTPPGQEHAGSTAESTQASSGTGGGSAGLLDDSKSSRFSRQQQQQQQPEHGTDTPKEHQSEENAAQGQGDVPPPVPSAEEPSSAKEEGVVLEGECEIRQSIKETKKLFEAAAANKGVIPTHVLPSPLRREGSSNKGGDPAVIRSTHDRENTCNVSQLLRSGVFKFQPLKDVIPRDELVRMRVEDGIDATRKEDYLSEEQFVEVFGTQREAFAKLPLWRRIQAKKKVQLF